MAITIKNEREIELLRRAGEIVGLAHAAVQPAIRRRDIRQWGPASGDMHLRDAGFPPVVTHAPDMLP